MYARLTLALIVAVLLAGTHWKTYVMGQQAVRVEWDRDKAERVTLALQAEQAARAREQELVAARQNAEVRYAQVKKRAATAAAGAQSELGQLRDELATHPDRDPTGGNPGAAHRADDGTRLERNLLGHCAAALVEVAADADRLEAIVLGLQSYVKQVCLAPR
jgi:hypothetical protein